MEGCLVAYLGKICADVEINHRALVVAHTRLPISLVLGPFLEGQGAVHGLLLPLLPHPAIGLSKTVEVLKPVEQEVGEGVAKLDLDAAYVGFELVEEFGGGRYSA